MPVVEVNIRDLEKLVGRSLDLGEIEYYLPALKCEIETIEDEIVEYEATHDRPDLFSVEGLARALKGLLEIETGLRKFDTTDKGFKLLSNGPDYRPYVLGAVVRNVSLDEEAVRQLMGLQERLHTTYCRNRRRVSIGLYDLDTIKPPIEYKAVDPTSISFIPLEETEEMNLLEILEKTEKGRAYAHLVKGREKYPLLVDSNGKVLSFPPIINSEDTKVTEETKNIFIDVTGTHLQDMMEVLTIVATSVAERGELIEYVTVIKGSDTLKTPNLEPFKLEFDPGLVEKVGGVNVSREEAKKYLEMMRHGVKVEKNKLEVVVAPYRLDVLHPVDLVEDILMAYGYDNLEPEPLWSTHWGMIHPIERFTKSVRDLMVGLGFQEVANYMMSNPETLVTKMGLQDVKLIEVVNPKMEKYTCLRNWIIPQLLEVIAVNEGLGWPLKIFEVGDVVIVDEREDNRARSERHLAALIASPETTLTDILVVLKALLKSLRIEYKLVEDIHPSFIDGRFARVKAGEELGIVGEIHPKVLGAFEIKVPVSVLELNLEKMLRLI